MLMLMQEKAGAGWCLTADNRLGQKKGLISGQMIITGVSEERLGISVCVGVCGGKVS